MYSRQIRLLGIDKCNALQSSTLAVIGLGGVGGYVVEMFARVGIKKIIICDGDNIDISNLNRQIIALSDNVGKNKAKEFEKRIKSINKDIEVVVYDKNYTKDNKFDLSQCDYVVDAIDSIEDKVELIKDCQKNNIPLVSSMGAGNRIAMCDFEIMDIYKTSNDGLAKKLRSLLRKEGIKNLNVALATTSALKLDKCVGSICYTPALAGIKIASFVINELLEEKYGKD